MIASASPDPNTKVGAIIFRSQDGSVEVEACNTFPDGISGTKKWRLLRPHKYDWIEHAERRAILLAANRRIQIRRCSILVSGGFPCPACSRAIIQSGISSVYYEFRELDVTRWEKTYDISREMLGEAGISFEYISQ